MDFKIGTALPAPSDSDISKFERCHRIILPIEFKSVLKKGNGAVPIQNGFEQECRERFIESMLCLLENPSKDEVNGWHDISVVITQIGSRLTDDPNLIGSDVIPFADLFAGDLVCLDFRRHPKSPTVVVWNHETSKEFNPDFDKVADSFSEFEKNLKILP
jgi:hypothetical protein